MKYTFRPILFLFLVSHSVYAAPTPAEIEAKIGQLIRETEITRDTGVGIAVIRDGQVILARGYGLKDRNPQQPQPVTADTLFAIASTTKAFTAAALMILKEDGLIDLDQPVQESHLSDFELQNIEASRQMSAMDMLTHRSGLMRSDFLLVFSPFNRGEIYRRLKYLPMNPKSGMGFREGFQYNNHMYMTAGLLLERASGMTWDRFLMERIMNPLDMTGVVYSHLDAQKAPDHAFPYYGRANRPFMDLSASAPAGAIFAGASHMAKWIQFFLNKGRTSSGTRLMSEEAITELYSPRVKMGDQTWYGMGWIEQWIGDHRYIWHNGGVDGFSSQVSFLPDLGLGLVILTNQGGEDGLTELLSLKIYDYLLGRSENGLINGIQPSLDRLRFPKIPPASIRNFSVKSFTKPTLDQFEGTYVHPGYGEFNVMRIQDRLYMKYYRHLWELTPSDSEATYLIKLPVLGETAQLPLEFLFQNGRVTGAASLVHFDMEVPPIEFQKIAVFK